MKNKYSSHSETPADVGLDFEPVRQQASGGGRGLLRFIRRPHDPRAQLRRINEKEANGRVIIIEEVVCSILTTQRYRCRVLLYPRDESLIRANPPPSRVKHNLSSC